MAVLLSAIWAMMGSGAAWCHIKSKDRRDVITHFIKSVEAIAGRHMHLYGAVIHFTGEEKYEDNFQEEKDTFEEAANKYEL